MHALSRRMVSFSGGMLMGIAVFWVLPEMADFLRWPVALTWITGGFALLWVVDRYVYPVCPACSPAHEHEHCQTQLHGFATPLLAAAALHSALDGWSAVAAQSSSFGPAFLLGIAVHKLPEGIALGVIARAAMEKRSTAFAWCAIAESATLVERALSRSSRLIWVLALCMRCLRWQAEAFSISVDMRYTASRNGADPRPRTCPRSRASPGRACYGC